MSSYKIPIAVVAENKSVESRAKILAQKLKLPYFLGLEKIFPDTYPYFLLLTCDHLELHVPSTLGHLPLTIDFLSKKNFYRQKQSQGFKSELIFKAVGLKNKEYFSILDLTAGLGRDSFMLASKGCEVIMLERSPIIAALLEDALQRLTSVRNLKLHLISIDAKKYLLDLLASGSACPDVIYLDPMYPKEEKSALAKKELRILRAVVGDDEDADDLLVLAKKIAKKRVVVKRSRLAPSLANATPDITFQGSSSRFDVYLKKL